MLHVKLTDYHENNRQILDFSWHFRIGLSQTKKLNATFKFNNTDRTGWASHGSGWSIISFTAKFPSPSEGTQLLRQEFKYWTLATRLRDPQFLNREWFYFTQNDCWQKAAGICAITTWLSVKKLPILVTINKIETKNTCGFQKLLMRLSKPCVKVGWSFRPIIFLHNKGLRFILHWPKTQLTSATAGELQLRSGRRPISLPQTQEYSWSRWERDGEADTDNLLNINMGSHIITISSY